MSQPDFPPATIVSSQTYLLPSTLIGDNYEIAIRPPWTYATSTRRYPALYLLDAPAVFGLAVPTVLSLSADGLVPELLIVGIGKHILDLDEWWPIRGRDYAPKPLPSQPGSGHAATFLKFIRSELIPYIDGNFRTDPADRTLCGHSLGGTLVLSALLTMPDLFRRYIASSPAVVDEGVRLLDDPVNLPSKADSIRRQLFISVGSQDHEYGPHIEAFITAIRNQNYPGLMFESTVLEGYAHISASAPGFIQGLQTVFSER